MLVACRIARNELELVAEQALEPPPCWRCERHIRLYRVSADYDGDAFDEDGHSWAPAWRGSPMVALRGCECNR